MRDSVKKELEEVVEYVKNTTEKYGYNTYEAQMLLNAASTAVVLKSILSELEQLNDTIQSVVQKG